VYLARVTGRVVATRRSPGTEGVALQWIQPLDEDGRAMGRMLVASAAISSGPGDLVHYVDGREAALACPETFVPVDAAIIGFVEAAWNGNRRLGQGPADPEPPSVKGAPPAAKAAPARNKRRRG
jgi:microcompartment protein CcmK/EutM